MPFFFFLGFHAEPIEGKAMRFRGMCSPLFRNNEGGGGRGEKKPGLEEWASESRLPITAEP